MTTQKRKEHKDKFKASEGLIKIGYNRFLEKFKDIRQTIPAVIASGTRSGSGRIELKQFDLLFKMIYKLLQQHSKYYSVQIVTL